MNAGYKARRRETPANNVVVTPIRREQPRPEPTVAEGQKEEKLTVHLAHDLIERVKNASYWNPRLTIASIAELGIKYAVELACGAADASGDEAAIARLHEKSWSLYLASGTHTAPRTIPVQSSHEVRSRDGDDSGPGVGSHHTGKAVYSRPAS